MTGSYELLTRAARDNGRINDTRFERLFAPKAGQFKYYLPNPVPPGTVPDESETVQALERVKAAGYTPDFILDIGASTGVWSAMASLVYPNCRYILAEPLVDRYLTRKTAANFEWIGAAVSDQKGEADFKVSDDFYNSSLLHIGNISSEVDLIRVPVTTVDSIVETKKLVGRCIMKIDVQYAEHLVVAGAGQTIRENCDLIMLELTLKRAVPTAYVFSEMVALMDGFGFVPFDDVGGWRSPLTGFLEQKDVLFARANFLTDIPGSAASD